MTYSQINNLNLAGYAKTEQDKRHLDKLNSDLIKLVDREVELTNELDRKIEE